MLTTEVETGTCRSRKRNKRLSSPWTGSRLDPEPGGVRLGKPRGFFSTEMWRMEAGRANVNMMRPVRRHWH